MPNKGDFGSSELHKTVPGGERVLIRRARPEDVALYRDFLADVSAEDLRLRFFADVAELSAAEIDKLTHLDYRHDMAFVALDEDTGHMLGLVRLKDELDEKTVCGACMGTCWSKTRPCCKCAPSSVSTRRTWARTSGALCSISEMSAASVAVQKSASFLQRVRNADF